MEIFYQVQLWKFPLQRLLIGKHWPIGAFVFEEGEAGEGGGIFLEKLEKYRNEIEDIKSLILNNIGLYSSSEI